MIFRKETDKRSKGFTLIELQVAALISLVTLLVIISLYLFSWRSFAIGNTLLDVYANSRNAIAWMMKDIRCAKQVASSVAITGSPGQYYSTTDSSIVLMVPSIDSSGNVVNSCYDYIIYLLQGQDMHRIVQKNPASSRINENRIIARHCGTLVFSSAGVALSGLSASELSAKNTVSIYLPINKTTVSLSGSGTVTESIEPTTVVRLRNK